MCRSGAPSTFTARDSKPYTGTDTIARNQTSTHQLSAN